MVVVEEHFIAVNVAIATESCLAHGIPPYQGFLFHCT